jgi:site-specific DNA-methyltransferase (cytosine-N4-specific)
MVELIDVRIGDARKLIHELKDKSIDCVVTSPPYWSLRDYKTEPIIFDENPDCEHAWGNEIVINKGNPGNMTTLVGTQTANLSKSAYNYGSFCSKCGAWKGQLGLEPTPVLFIIHLIDFFDNVKLKLKDEGNVFVNLGDTYSGSGGAGGDYNKGGLREGQSKYKQGKNNYSAKCLCLIPERFAIGMVERGWILRNSIIWQKPNHMPESVTDRLTKAHEVIYHFVKQQKYYYNLDAIREPLAESSFKRITQKNVLNQSGGFKQEELRGIPNNGNGSRCNKMVQSLAKKYQCKFENTKNPEAFSSPRARTLRDKHIDNQSRTTLGLHNGRDPLNIVNPNGKNPGDVWNITLQPYPESHFAVFPLELVRRPILAGCPVGGTVLDPFAGSGTVGEFCRNNERNAILYELNPDYKKLIEDRTMVKVPELYKWCNL